jgi:hypothetical protein
VGCSSSVPPVIDCSFEKVGLCRRGLICPDFLIFDDTIGADEWQDEMAKIILYELQI